MVKENAEYLKSDLKWEDSRVMDLNTGYAVMMDWETPIMLETAQFLCHYPGKVLNIGHGMGIIDGFISFFEPIQHFIVEGHPQVYEEQLVKKGWTQKENTHVIFSDWRDVNWNEFPFFDAIYIDTFQEDMEDFMINVLPKILAPGGRFSWFNNNKKKEQELEESKAKIMENHGYIIRSRAIKNFKAPDPYLQSGTDMAYWFPDWDTYIIPEITNKTLGIKGYELFKLWK